MSQTEFPETTKIFGQNSSTGAREAIWKDTLSGALVDIEIPHAAIHLGKYFSHSGLITLANGASYDHLLITPGGGGKLIHLRLFVISGTSTPVTHLFYEGTTVSANGTSVPGYNFNRNFSNATLGLYHTPTVTTTGTALHTVQIIGSKQNGGVGETSGTEWVLTTGTTYLSRMTNVSGGSSDLSYLMEWYEL